MFLFRRMSRAALAAFTGSVLLASGASASTLVDATSPETILEIAKGFGSAELSKDSGGDPMISGRMEGTRYSIMFYGCKDGKSCKDIQLGTAWGGTKVTMDDVNRWNREARFSKAYLDDENDPVLEMVVNLNYGVTRKNLEDTIDWWRVAIERFRRDVLK